MERTAVLLSIAVCCLLAGAAKAQEVDPGERVPGASGLPLPRFVSLDTDEANLRSGPGRRYPIAWVYVREGLPLEITAEYDTWRRVRDVDGAEGWMHASLLSGRRTGLVTGAVRALRSGPEPDAPVVLRAEPGVGMELLRCRPAWCEARIAGRRGWIHRGHFWGTHRGESFE